MATTEYGRGRLLGTAIVVARVVRILGIPSLLATTLLAAHVGRYASGLSWTTDAVISVILFALLSFLALHAHRGHTIACAVLACAFVFSAFFPNSPKSRRLFDYQVHVLLAVACVSASAFLRRLGCLPRGEYPMVPYISHGPDWRCSGCREWMPATQDQCWSCRALRVSPTPPAPPNSLASPDAV